MRARISIGLVVALMLLVLFPVSWLIALHLSGVSIQTREDPLGILTTAAGVMGAIFTAGGLVVALAAVITFLSIEQRIAEGVRKAMEQESKRIEERADAQIQAHIDLSSARQSHWRVALPLVEKAIRTYEGLQGQRHLPDARRQMGLQLVQSAQWKFMAEHGISPAVMYYDEGQAYDFEEDVPLDAATDWLSRAIAKGEDRDGVVLAALAVIAALQGNSANMWHRLFALPKGQAARAWKEYLGEAARRAILVRGCQADPHQLTELSNVLGASIPMRDEEVAAQLRTLADSNASMEQWVALTMPKDAAGDPQRLPHIPQIRALYKERGGDGSWRCIIGPHVPGPTILPATPESTGWPYSVIGFGKYSGYEMA
jgi:hypothetical protein